MKHPTTSRGKPVAMTIAGSDNSAGAGIQADLKAFAASGAYGLTSLTCIVAEVPGLVERVDAVDPALVAAQIRLGFDAFPVAAVKTGMLFSAQAIRTVVREIASAGVGRGKMVPLVVDPVMVASSGDPLLEPEAITWYREALLPLATLITPNLDEAAVLLGDAVTSAELMPDAARQLHGMFGSAVLLKGGHLRNATALDILYDGKDCLRFEAPFRRGVSTHGTGCTFSAAITARLACGDSMPEAVASAKALVTRAIEGFHEWKNRNGKSTMALDHFA